jgi:DNA mismatch endonuclease (patch repair protein)
MVKPAQRAEFWAAKRQSNMERDLRNKISLESLGWRVMVVWECEIGAHDLLKKRLKEFLHEGHGDPCRPD